MTDSVGKPATTDTVDDGNNNRTISYRDVVSRAEHLSHGDNQFHKYCDQYSENAVTGHGGIYDTAKQWQDQARNKGWLNTKKQAPAGVPVFFNTSNPDRHVAISAGNGMIWSTDGNGQRIGKVPQGNFGGYAGWTSAVGGRHGYPVQFINYDKSSAPPIKRGIVSMGNPSSTPSPKAQTAPTAPTAPITSSMSDDMSSGPVGTDLTQLNPTRAVQSSSGSSSMIVR
jgi:hypothetical protein